MNKKKIEVKERCLWIVWEKRRAGEKEQEKGTPLIFHYVEEGSVLTSEISSGKKHSVPGWCL